MMQEITVDAVIDNGPIITSFVDEILEQYDCNMKAQMQIDISIDEIFGNIAYYAYEGKVGKVTVYTDFDEASRTFKMIFKDEGVPYNPLLKDDPDITLSAEERDIGGLGIFMVKKQMDSIDYAYQDGKNILTITKNI